MAVARLPRSLPRTLYPFFWDVDAESVNPSKSSKYVINRLLDKGNLEAARWVLKHFPKSLIVDTFKTRRDFSFDTATFWAHYLDFPVEEAKCMQEPYRSLRKQLWPY